MNGVVEVDGVKDEDAMDQTDDKANEGIRFKIYSININCSSVSMGYLY